MNAVEAKETELATEPQVTISGLSDRGDRAFEKTVADGPGLMSVLIDIERGVQRERRGAAA